MSTTITHHLESCFKLLSRLHRHHDSYVAINGHVRACTSCGRPPKDLERQLAVVRAVANHPWVTGLGPRPRA
jgi:hypothetical protein